MSCIRVITVTAVNNLTQFVRISKPATTDYNNHRTQKKISTIEKLEPTKSPKYKIRVLLRGEDLS